MGRSAMQPPTKINGPARAVADVARAGPEATHAVRLVTREGELVLEVALPSPPFPEVVCWRGRAFVHRGGLIDGGQVIYQEGDLKVFPEKP